MSKGNESMDEHEELVDGGWIAERMGIARPSVARVMARLGVPRYEFGPKCVRYPKSRVEAAIAACLHDTGRRNNR